MTEPSPYLRRTSRCKTSLWMIAVSGLTCRYLIGHPITVSNLIILAPNLWQGSIQLGRMTSNCRREGASGEAETLNRRESIATVADVELGMHMGWCLMLTSGHILTLARGTAVDHASDTGGRGRLPHVGGMLETGEEARTLIAKGADGRFSGDARSSCRLLCSSSTLFPWLLPRPLLCLPCFM